jgi:hypothetical protein
MVWDTFIGDAKTDQASALAKYATAKKEWEKEMRCRAQSRTSGYLHLTPIGPKFLG